MVRNITHLSFFSLRFRALVIWCIPVDDSDIINSADYSGDWNSSTSSVDFSGPFLAAGYWMVFPVIGDARAERA